MEFEIQTGLAFETLKTVELRDSAIAHGSGALEVFATPAMIALMEHCSMMCIAEKLPKDFGSVGIEINVQHLKASPIGAQVRGIAVVTEVESRKVTFSVEVYEDETLVGVGTHVRFIVDNQKFMKKIQKN